MQLVKSILYNIYIYTACKVNTIQCTYIYLSCMLLALFTANCSQVIWDFTNRRGNPPIPRNKVRGKLQQDGAAGPSSDGTCREVQNCWWLCWAWSWESAPLPASPQRCSGKNPPCPLPSSSWLPYLKLSIALGGLESTLCLLLPPCVVGRGLPCLLLACVLHASLNLKSPQVWPRLVFLRCSDHSSPLA